MSEDSLLAKVEAALDRLDAQVDRLRADPDRPPYYANGIEMAVLSVRHAVDEDWGSISEAALPGQSVLFTDRPERGRRRR